MQWVLHALNKEIASFASSRSQKRPKTHTPFGSHSKYYSVKDAKSVGKYNHGGHS